MKFILFQLADTYNHEDDAEVTCVNTMGFDYLLDVVFVNGDGAITGEIIITSGTTDNCLRFAYPAEALRG